MSAPGEGVRICALSGKWDAKAWLCARCREAREKAGWKVVLLDTPPAYEGRVFTGACDDCPPEETALDPVYPGERRTFVSVRPARPESDVLDDIPPFVPYRPKRRELDRPDRSPMADLWDEGIQQRKGA